MSNTKIILYECSDIYQILFELSESLKFTIEKAENERDLEILIKIQNLFNYK